MDHRILKLAKQLPREDRVTFQAEFRERKRTSGLGILFALLLGSFGVHQFYIGNNKRGIWYLVVTAISIPLTFVVVGILGCIVITILCIRDALDMERLIAQANISIARDLILEINAINSLDY